MNMNDFISALYKAGLHHATVDTFNYCVYEPDFKQLLKDSGISRKYKLTSKELDVYVESLDNAYDHEYINQTGVIAVWNDYILDRDLLKYNESFVKQIMTDLEVYLTDLIEPLYQSYLKSLTKV